MTTFRGFIAIEIKPTDKIKELEQAIRKTGADVKLVEPQNIHITLKFLGDTNEDDLESIERFMKETACLVKPFSITLQGTGVFPNENYLKVIWIGINDKGDIKTLTQTLDEKLTILGFQKETRGYSPHLTIGRVKTARNKAQLLQTVQSFTTVEFAQQKIHSITLKKSELTPTGPIYTTLREIPL
jgi:RNA 2',3'-cyclic 3'-phosphodiesterase